MSEEIKVTEVTEEAMTKFEKVLKLLRKYGPFRMIGAVIFFVFFSLMTYIAVNPEIVFKKYDEYITEVHQRSMDYRMKTSPLIRSYLNQLAMETGAERAYILEFHNGKSNPSGLQWQFGDLTFINDGTDDISDEIQNVALSRYSFVNIVHDDGYWYGSIDDLLGLDERFYKRMRLNEGQYYFFQMIYGRSGKEIGILGITFMDKENVPDKEHTMREVHKYSSTISPLLDESSIR